MITLPPTERESHRVDMVRSFGLLDLPRPLQHDEIAALARDLAGTRWALVTLVDAERVWFSGSANYPGSDSCRWSSYCTHVISNPQETTWIADAHDDFRFSRRASAMGEPSLRFYAGAPIRVNGHAVGTVCAFDPAPRDFDPAIAQSLARLANVVAEDLSARHREQAMRTALLESADALVECDDHGVITDWSGGAAQLFGFAAEEALGRNIDMLAPPEQKAACGQAFQTWRDSGGAPVGRRIELSARRKDGSLVDIELWMSVAHMQGVPHIHANIRDISERTAQAAALRRATDQAEAASEAKTTFLTNMSHELRTPLNGVIGVVDLLSRTQQSEHQRELTAIIKASSDQLRRLIGDVLDLARVEAGELILTEATMSLRTLVEDLTAAAALAAKEKGVAVHSELDSDVAAHVTGDALRLKQVLTNLVANAVKFTEKGSVVIRVSRDGDVHRFEVRDTGIGFDPEQREAVFGRFQQADGTITRRFGGSGLGLSICSELVTAMGGELDCQSAAGEGATFWFTVPLAEVCVTAAEKPASSEEPTGPGRVLVVDDNPTNRRVAELILKTTGVDVTCVEDGRQAVDAFLAGGFDAILMDMMMPVMDGATATRAIREIERQNGLARTPIIMLTANSLAQHIEVSLQAGADLHLPKPVTPEALFSALARLNQADEAHAEFYV